MAGARVVRNIDLVTTPDGFDDLVGTYRKCCVRLSLTASPGAKFKDMMTSYFALFDKIQVHSLEDLVKFNKDHADQELPLGEWKGLLRSKHSLVLTES